MATDTTTSSTSNLPSSSISTLRSTSSIPTTKLSTRRSVVSSTRQTIKQCPPQIPQSRYNIEFNEHCYEFILRAHKTWPDAEHDCRRKGGHLVTINSMTEQKFIYTSVQVNGKTDNVSPRACVCYYENVSVITWYSPLIDITSLL